MPKGEDSGGTCANVGRVAKQKAPGSRLTLSPAVTLRIDHVCGHSDAAVRTGLESDEHRAVRRLKLCLKGLRPQFGQTGTAFKCLEPVPFGVFQIGLAKAVDPL